MSNYDKIIFSSRAEAERIRSEMKNFITDYGFVSVADYYELCGQRPAFGSHNYGWTSVSNANIVKYKGVKGVGYTINLERPMAID